MRSVVPHSTANLGATRTLLTANCSSNSGLSVINGLIVSLSISLWPSRLQGRTLGHLGCIRPAIAQSILVQVVYRPAQPAITSLIAGHIRSQWLERIRIISAPVVIAIVHPIVPRHPVPPLIVES